MESLYDEALDSPVINQDVEDEQESLDTEVVGLIYHGYLTDTVTVGSHEIRIRTLKIGEELEASLAASQWSETTEAGRALATALVAASIVSIDGQPLLEGLGPHEQTIAAKFDYLRRNWYWVTVRAVYKKYDDLLRTVLDSADEVGKD